MARVYRSEPGQRDGQAARGIRGFRQFHQDGRGNGIGEVGDEFPIGPVARFTHEIGEGVVVEQGEIRLGGEVA